MVHSQAIISHIFLKQKYIYIHSNNLEKKLYGRLKLVSWNTFKVFRFFQQENKPEKTDKQNHWQNTGKCCNYSRHALFSWPVRVPWFHYMTFFSTFSWYVPQPPQRNMKSNFQKELLFLIWIDFFKGSSKQLSVSYRSHQAIPTHQGAVLAREVCCF